MKDSKNVTGPNTTLLRITQNVHCKNAKGIRARGARGQPMWPSSCFVCDGPTPSKMAGSGSDTCRFKGELCSPIRALFIIRILYTKALDIVLTIILNLGVMSFLRLMNTAAYLPRSTPLRCWKTNRLYFILLIRKMLATYLIFSTKSPRPFDPFLMWN